MVKYSVVVHGEAYSKAILHTLKYPYAYAVVGFLLGRRKDAHIEVVDAVPVFHTRPLAPMVSTALKLASKHVEEQKDVELVGVYLADLPHDGSSALNVSKAIAETLAKNSNSAACVIRILSDKLGLLATPDVSSVEVFTNTVSCLVMDTVKPSNDKQQISLMNAEEAIQDLKTQIVAAADAKPSINPLHECVTDFDDYLETPTRKWVFA
eukprot:TRINITY_DN4170_c0_g2_i1.p1 TRINITY_DN4170_c0_g2~~TRINITY_DN4170_c0_g2_i1.p1  ORF type:complete len:209 (+),score=51.25 TRINITY_DN4170_c0_g2_i1:391-1017(+)